MDSKNLLDTKLINVLLSIRRLRSFDFYLGVSFLVLRAWEELLENETNI